MQGNRLQRLVLVILISLGIGTGWAHAQVSITGMGSPYTQNFDTLANSGSSSTVPQGWAFAETGANANATYTAGSGSSNTGDTYSFGTGVSTERAFGGLQSNNLVPTIGAAFANNSGEAITRLDISYTGEQWRLGASDRPLPDRIDFQYSTDATSLTTGTWIDFNPLDFTQPLITGTPGALDGNAAPNRTAITATVDGLSIPNGAVFWIRWASVDVSGSDDGLAVDDFSLTAYGAPGPAPQAIPTLSQWGQIILSLLAAGSAAWYIRRRSRATPLIK